MTTQQKLIRFLQAKNKAIYRYTKLRYIYGSDIQYIEDMDTARANDIWKAIKHNVFYQDAKGLTSQICPWCQEKEITNAIDCSECTYGRTHGICFRSKNPRKYVSHYDHIYQILDSDNIKDYKILSNLYYKQLIIRIENIDSNNNA